MRRVRTLQALCGLVALAYAAAPSASAVEGRTKPRHFAYRQTNLVSDIAGVALNTDPNLVNPWGMAINPSGPIWVANADSGTSTVYDGEGNPLPSEASPLVVTIPAPAGSDPDELGEPTGIVFNASSDFVVSAGGHSGAGRFLFATEGGTIAGWSPAVDIANAVTAYTAADDANYKGLALLHTASGNRLYAADLHNAKIDVFDGSFQPVTLSGSFTDPNLPAGFAPFNVQAIGSSLIVTYAKQDPDAEDEEAGPGLGYVDMYDADGHLVRRIASGGPLNAPWGVALAPRTFGRFGGALLIGNFGDGRINVLNPQTGAFLGQLSDRRGKPLTISGLWSLAFSPSETGRGRKDAELYFTAGIADESHGLFGEIEPDK